MSKPKRDPIDEPSLPEVEELSLPREDEQEIREPDEVDDTGLGDEPDPDDEDRRETADNAVFNDPERSLPSAHRYSA